MTKLCQVQMQSTCKLNYPSTNKQSNLQKLIATYPDGILAEIVFLSVMKIGAGVLHFRNT